MLIAPTARPAGAGRLSGLERLAAALVLVTLLWRASLLLIDSNGCGLPVPHHHVLVGDAGPAHLAAHLASERACAQAAQATAPPVGVTGGVLSLNEIPSAQFGLLLMLTLALLGRLDCGLRVPAALAHAGRQAAARSRSLAIPPPTPIPLPRPSVHRCCNALNH